jgi:hypothetical protein
MGFGKDDRTGVLAQTLSTSRIARVIVRKTDIARRHQLLVSASSSSGLLDQPLTRCTEALLKRDRQVQIELFLSLNTPRCRPILTRVVRAPFGTRRQRDARGGAGNQSGRGRSTSSFRPAFFCLTGNASVANLPAAPQLHAVRCPSLRFAASGQPMRPGSASVGISRP